MILSKQHKEIINKIKLEKSECLHNIVFALAKNNQLIMLENVKEENYDEISAYLIFDNKKVLSGTLSYRSGKGTFFYNRETVIHNIKVDDPYRNLGIAGYMERFLVEKTVLNRIDYITGKFYPDSDNSEKFYLSKGYEIVKEGYETVLLKTISDKELQLLSENKTEINGITFYKNIQKEKSIKDDRSL